jgi:charged multivesicular body protein 3
MNIIQAGIMEEMMDDTLDMQDEDELEEEADAEVDKVLFELTNGKLGEAGSVGTELPVCISLCSGIDLELTLRRRRRLGRKRKRRRERWSNIDNN